MLKMKIYVLERAAANREPKFVYNIYPENKVFYVKGKG